MPIRKTILLLFCTSPLVFSCSENTVDTYTNSPQETTKLYQNYPNPFRDATMLRFVNPATQYVSLRLYNSQGQEIIVFINEELRAGVYEVEWNASGFEPGLYIAYFTAGSYTERIEMFKQ